MPNEKKKIHKRGRVKKPIKAIELKNPKKKTSRTKAEPVSWPGERKAGQKELKKSFEKHQIK